MIKKIAASLVLALGIITMTACSSGSGGQSTLITQGPFKGMTYLEALSVNNIEPPSANYYKQVCSYLETPMADKYLSDGEFITLLVSVTSDLKIDMFTASSSEAEKVGILVAASVLVGCPEYLPAFDQFIDV